MNKAKTILKAPKENKKKKVQKDYHSRKTPILVGALVFLVVVICLVVGVEQLQRKVILKVNDSKVYYDDAMFYVYTTENQFTYLDQLYQQFNSGSYWDGVNDEGVSNRVLVKENVLASMIQTEILYDQAVKAGYTVTKEDTAKAEELTRGCWDQLNTKQKTKSRMTYKNILKLTEKMQVMQRYKQDLIDGFDIDDEAIKAEFKFEDYRQYDIQYYFASTKTKDAEGNEADASADEKQALKTEMEALLAKARTAEDFTKLLPEEADDADKSSIEYKSAGFVVGDEQFTEALEKEFVKMNNDEISAVLEGEDGYYFVKMINNNSTAKYDETVKDAISDAENSRFDEEYDKLYGEYKIKLNQSLWDFVTMGKLIGLADTPAENTGGTDDNAGGNEADGDTGEGE